MSSNQTVTAASSAPFDAATTEFSRATVKLVDAATADPMAVCGAIVDSYTTMPTAGQVASDAVDAAGAWLSPESDKETQQQAGKTALVVGLGVAMAAFGWAAWKVANVKTDETGKK